MKKGLIKSRLVVMILAGVIAVIVFSFIFGLNIGSFFDFFPDYSVVDPVWDSFDGNLVQVWTSEKADEPLLRETKDQELKENTEDDGGKEILKFYKDILNAAIPTKVYVFEKNKETLVILKAYALEENVDPNPRTNPIRLSFYRGADGQSLHFVWDASKKRGSNGLVGDVDKDDLHDCAEWVKHSWEYWESYKVGEEEIYEDINKEDFFDAMEIVCSKDYDTFVYNLLKTIKGDVRVTWGSLGVLSYTYGKDVDERIENLKKKLIGWDNPREHYYASWGKEGVLVGQQIKYLCSFNGKVEQECILDRSEGKFCPTEDKEKNCLKDGGNCLCVEDYTADYVLKYVQGNEMWDAQYSRPEGKKKHCLRGAYPGVDCREHVE